MWTGCEGGKDRTGEPAKALEPFWEVREDFLQEEICDLKSEMWNLLCSS